MSLLFILDGDSELSYRGGHPKTRTRVRLLGPCFKTGRMKPYDRQRPRRVSTHMPQDSPTAQTHCTQSAMLAEPGPGRLEATLNLTERLSFQLSSLNNGRATLNFEPKPTPI